MAVGVDTHAHLNHPRLYRRLPEVMERAHRAGIEQIVVVGYDLPSSELAVEMADAYPSLWAAVGVHPHDAEAFDDAADGRLRLLAQRGRVVAIGETGLDFYRDLSPRHRQVEAFERHLALAEELSLPVIIHCRQAQAEVLALARESRLKMVWHCFEGTWEQAERALELGMWLGLAGTITYQRAEELRAVAARAPAERILLETDSPYLSPEPREGRDNEPARLGVIAEWVGRARGMDREEAMALGAENARKAFGLPGGGG